MRVIVKLKGFVEPQTFMKSVNRKNYIRLDYITRLMITFLIKVL